MGGVGGLCLQVKRRGEDWVTASWVLRRTIHGARRDVGLGGWPDVTLAQARERARQVLDEVWRGGDPFAARRAARAAVAEAQAEKALPTFEAAMRGYLKDKTAHFKHASDRRNLESRMLTYVVPLIGATRIDLVTTADVLGVLRQEVEGQGGAKGEFWTTIPDTASRVRQRIEDVFKYARYHGWRTGENPAQWAGHLDHALASPTRLRPAAHQPALPYEALPAFVAALRARKPSPSASALLFLILTAARSGEVRKATWAEVDVDKGLWTVPAERMKAGREHRVALPRAAVDLLKATKPVAGTDLVWPGQGLKEPMSDMTLAALVKKMQAAEVKAERKGWVDARTGRTATPHGFRSTFRDWAAEQTSYPSEMAELAGRYARL